MLETNSLIRINEHLVALLDRRDSIRENELCRLLRSTAEVNKLEIIEPIGQKKIEIGCCGCSKGGANQQSAENTFGASPGSR